MSKDIRDIGINVAKEVGKEAVKTTVKFLKKTMEGQSDGNVLQRSRGVYRRIKKHRLSKLLNSSVNYTEQHLGIRGTATPWTWSAKHPVSEYGINGGCMGIVNDGTLNTTPMHCYDLNLFIGSTEDSTSNYPNVATSQCDAINGRAWVWMNNNSWSKLVGNAAATDLRYYINDPRTIVQAQNPSTKVYRKNIKVDLMAYACTQMSTRFKFDIIRITDPMMCPDYESSLTGDQLNTFRQNWQNLTRAYTINPMLKGIEPGPDPVKPWFKIVASKTLELGEQVADVNKLPSVQTRLHLKINEAQNYAWDMKNFGVETGAATYDGVPQIEVNDISSNQNFKHKPYYTSRYYLLIRALSPVDVGDVGDGAITGAFEALNTAGISTANCAYMPTYDIAIRTSFLTVNAN